MSYTAPDYGGYARQRRDVDSQYGQQATTNAYGRFLGQQRGQRNLGDMQQSFGRQYTPYKARFAQRGLAGPGVNSGSMQESMNRFVGDYARDYGRTQQDLTQQGQQYDLQQAQLDQWRQEALRGIEESKANEIAWAAQNVQQLRDMLGGL